MVEERPKKKAHETVLRFAGSLKLQLPWLTEQFHVLQDIGMLPHTRHLIKK